MKRDLMTLALGVIIGGVVGMGVGPALATAYSGNPSQDTVRALEDIASTLKSRDTSRAVQENTRAIQDISRALQSIDSTLRSQRR
ncbi:MAG: hypothetical protein PVH21_11955 [Myxococcales bacterium]